MSKSAKQQKPQRSWIVELPWRRIVVILGITLVSVVLVVISLLQEPTLSVTCNWFESGQAAVQAESAPGPRPLQVILTGPKTRVPEVVSAAKSEGIELKPIRYCDVTYRGRRGLDSDLLPFPPKVLRNLTMHLYQIQGEPRPDLEKALETIDSIGSELGVSVDPNYLIGLLGQSACGEPYEVVGSPYEVVGSPYEVVGSPYEVVGSLGGLALPRADAAEFFWNQWAFQHIGIAPSPTDTLRDTGIAPTGAGVRVGVFDTSPFTESTRIEVEPTDGIPRAEAPVPWSPQAEPTTTVTVTFSIYYSYTLPSPPTDTSKLQDISDHGLYVAGLIRAVAPESEIEIYQVLNKYGCGSLFTLNEALYDFMAGVKRQRGTLGGAVINLSLGIHKPRTPIQDSVPGDGANQQSGVAAAQALDFLVEDEIESLRTAVLAAHNEGAVLVAAAGNDSYLASRDGQVLSPQIPAQYPFVIGVAASNAMRERSCFSNWGDVAAPGGDGGLNPQLAKDFEELAGLDCAPTANLCSGDCKDALISLVQDPQPGYAYWTGTSFSTPLVSGLAALVIDAAKSRAGCGPCNVSPNLVFDAIRCGSSTPDGVINVPATLYRCLP